MPVAGHIYDNGPRVRPFLLSEAKGQRSREHGVITVAGTIIPSGTVLGQITVGAATSAAVAGNVGNGTMGTVTLSAGARNGVYRLTILAAASNAGSFVVEDPEGVVIGNGDVATAFSAGGLAFTLADGSTDFASGDQFTITVAVGTNKWVPYADANVNGSGVAAAILYEATDDRTGDVTKVIIARDAEVNRFELTGLDAAGEADLARAGIFVRGRSGMLGISTPAL